ncbi:unnamed protein product [Clavelina lepadiformis]|uniref:G-protein coupled receptors family 1 profile domain-containing protein n=1 Tax=Clavelina lepadiformis TaxID=159417 RepID=A0ABP0FDU8_CLALP
MNLKSTIFNTVVSFTYGYFWYRQWLLYSNPKLQHLRGKAMEIVTWLVLAFLIINPFIMFGFQFNGKLCEVQNQTCMVLKLNTVEFIPFVVVAFSYGFIQATLIFLYFYPLYKQHSTQETTGRKNVQISVNVISNEELKFEQNPNVTIANYTLSAIDANNNTTRFRRPKQTLQEKLRRWLLLSLICVFTDLISATVIAVFLLSKLPGNIISVMYLWHDASMFINCLCIVCCFKAYREMLFPYVKKKC